MLHSLTSMRVRLELAEVVEFGSRSFVIDLRFGGLGRRSRCSSRPSADRKRRPQDHIDDPEPRACPGRLAVGTRNQRGKTMPSTTVKYPAAA